ncbi:type II secretion system F family protein [Candidatus Sumerlaeota bacterium]|nr:type II secretion system F family protein [Candidatus Sumerlaeota bacterium]
MSPDTHEKRSLRDAIRERQAAKTEGETQEPAAAAAPAPAPASRAAAPGKGIVIGGPGLKQTSIFCRQLSTLLNVGIPLQRSLQILAERTQHPKLREIVKEIAVAIDSGSNLADSLEKHPKVFNNLFVNIVRIGEKGGILESALARLTEVLESKLNMRRKVMAISIYPVFVFTMMAIVIAVLLGKAVPAFTAELPAEAHVSTATAALMTISAFFEQYWLGVIGAIAAVLLGGFFYLRSNMGRRTLESALLTIPRLRNLSVNIALSRTMRSLGSLLAAGIPLMEALRVTADSSESPRMSKALRRVGQSLESGGKFETPLRDETVMFPPVITDMISVGEESGTLDTMLLNIADNCDDEVEAAIPIIQSLIEVALILIMGVVVLFIAFALFMPYFSMLDYISE